MFKAIACIAYIEECYERSLVTDYERQVWLIETLEDWYRDHPNHKHYGSTVII